RLDAEYRRATEIVAASSAGKRLAVLDKRLYNAELAIAGLDAALRDALPEKKAACEAKRADFVAQRQRLSAERSALLDSSPQQQQLIRMAAEVRQVWYDIGL